MNYEQLTKRLMQEFKNEYLGFSTDGTRAEFLFKVDNEKISIEYADIKDKTIEGILADIEQKINK